MHIVARIYEKREGILLLAFFVALIGLGVILYSLEARGQSKFYSFPNRGGAEGAKGNAMLHTLLQENVERRNETTANAASITALQAAADSSITALRDATEASLTTISDCGAQGMIFGRGHAIADSSDCIPSLQVANDGRVSLQTGMKFGDYTLCDPTTAGTMRYNAGAKRMEFCNGSIWGMLGGNVGCSINFPAVTNADLDTFYNTTDAVYSGETATASVAGATAATIRRNGADTGMASGVTINQGNSVGIRGRSASLFNQTANFTLDIGAYTACWQITTKQQDVMPDGFTFTDLTNQELNTLVTSNSVTVSGFDGPLTVSVSGQGNPQLKVGSGSWATSGQIDAGQSLTLRLTTASSYETIYTAALTLGGYSTNWTVTTRTNCATPGSQVFTVVGSHNFTIPEGCTVVAKLWGGGGGAGGRGSGDITGGGGAFAQKVINLAPGTTISVRVGGGGARGVATDYFNGGGGGGASSIHYGSTVLAAAGGGGGAGAGNNTSSSTGGPGGRGGGGGQNGESPSSGCGATGGAAGTASGVGANGASAPGAVIGHMAGGEGKGATGAPVCPGGRASGGYNGGGEGGHGALPQVESTYCDNNNIAAGGGGGGGFPYGGGGGGYCKHDLGSGGGGGGASIGDSVIPGNFHTPGNTADADYAFPAGRGGLNASGSGGRVVIRWQ